MRINRFAIALVAMALAACTGPMPPMVTPAPVPIEVTVPVTRLVEVTREPEATRSPIKMLVTVPVTVTREVFSTAGGLVQVGSACTTAITQWELNQCTAQERDDASRQLQAIVQRIRESYKDKPENAATFARLQSEWERWAASECEFAFLRVVTVDSGFVYEHGSMAPMLSNGCLTDKYMQRAAELKWFYLDQP